MERSWASDAVHQVGKHISAAGWVATRRDHGKLIFIDLRDRSGFLQVVFSEKDPELRRAADALRAEWVIRVEGTVRERPKGMENSNLPTGAVELEAAKLEILAQAKTPPFEIAAKNVNEEVRLKYRYLDLRDPRMQKNLELRHRATKFVRDFLSNAGFWEIETPILTKSTPEGARDYLVPSRLQPGSFYALPQSPQQYKQLLMVAGLEKYFQIARCFRDEDTRGDRQPEFTQIDIEVSFAGEEDILRLVEDMYTSLVKALTPEKQITAHPFPRMSYKEAMERYGTDAPDVRRDKNDPNELAFVFITDFPMFERKAGAKRWGAVHHPFTNPRVKNIEEMKRDPASVVADQYDLVLNGSEIGGGSIRNYDPEKLSAVFEVLGHTKKEIEGKFGYLLEAFQHGAPPSGGIALGWDRMLMILAGEPSIREVIAFPKTGEAQELMMGTPASVEKAQLDELGISVKKRRKK
ncbi:aspartate--tRNA ligase [Candidatus Azambacteria bacterium]|nr:aspartate--tRNA ligase [Candidatus Azambacteria bacterium]